MAVPVAPIVNNGEVLLLAFDTATPAVTVALRGDEGVLAEHTEIDARRHGELLAPGIEKVLADAGCSRTDLTGVAVGVGPGPFTGLRVGLMTARALADALDIPVYGVCTLDILAAAAATAALQGRAPDADPTTHLGTLNPAPPGIAPQTIATAAAAGANDTGAESASAGAGEQGGGGVRANAASADGGARGGATGDLSGGGVRASAASAEGGAQGGGAGAWSERGTHVGAISAVAARGAQRGEVGDLGVGEGDPLVGAVLGAAGGRFAVATDARRREVYWAIYDLTGRRETDPSVDRPADIAGRLAGLAVAGQGPVLYPEQFPYALDPALPSAAVLAELTARRLLEAPEALLPPVPLYLRRPDAVEPGARKSVTPA